jgi:glycine dehydrogenase subunit 1
MKHGKSLVHPYIPNSVPAVQQEMLAAVQAASVDEFFEDIPPELLLEKDLQLPAPFPDEYSLQRHVEGLLAQNTSCTERLSFLGAGCYQRHVPAVCDEINMRGEFLTAYAGEPYDDHGRFQTLFEYCSMMGELLNMEVVNVPTYDGYQAAATALRMACRMTGRTKVLIGLAINPDKYSKISEYLEPDIDIDLAPFHSENGELDIEALEVLLDESYAALYFEMPNYFGVLEQQAERITAEAHLSGVECVVYVEPSSLGVIKPPADYGADIVCGDIQSLGMHMNYGGGQAGFIATCDEERYVMEYPSRLFGIAPTRVPGEYGFGDVAYERTSFAVREEGKEWVGTAAALWGITAGVYLALMGPSGMVELGEGIMARVKYAKTRLAEVPGVVIPHKEAVHFQEILVNFDRSGKTAAEINQALLNRGIFGGVDISSVYPEFGQSALFAFSEVHTQADIDTLVSALEEVLA